MLSESLVHFITNPHNEDIVETAQELRQMKCPHMLLRSEHNTPPLMTILLLRPPPAFLDTQQMNLHNIPGCSSPKTNENPNKQKALSLLPLCSLWKPEPPLPTPHSPKSGDLKLCSSVPPTATDLFHICPPTRPSITDGCYLVTSWEL